MNYSQERNAKIAQLRERYRKRRRKQLAAVTGIVLVAVAFVVLLTLIVAGIRSCGRGDSAISYEQYSQAGSEGTIPQQVNSYTVPIAPWLVTLDENSLIMAGDTTNQRTSYPNYPVSYLAQYGFGQEDKADPTWDMPLSGTLTDLQATTDAIVTANQSLADPLALELKGYITVDSDKNWSVSIENALAGQLAVSGNVACVSYLLPDGYRIVGYNSSSGVKAWGKKVDVGENAVDVSGATPLYLITVEGYLAYFRDSTFGLLDTGTGREVRDPIDFGLDINDCVIDSNSKSVFLVVGDATAGYVVKHLNFRDGIPLDLYSFTLAEDEHASFSLVASGDRALLAYRKPGRRTGITLVGLEPGKPEPAVFSHDLSHGNFSDMVRAAGSEPCFLVAVNQNDASRPRGWGRLYIADFTHGTVSQAGQYNQPVDWLASIDSGSLALLHGGRILAWLPRLQQTVEIADLIYSEVMPVFSPSGGHVALLSYPPDYSLEQPGCQMQIMVLD